MANYYGHGRSNYIKVSDPEKFKELCEERGLTVIEQEGGGIGCISENEDGDINNFGYDDETGDEVERPDFMEEVAKILLDDEVFIWMSIGNEKMRYLSGYATAINNKGKTKSVNLNNIYTLGKKLGKNVTEAEY